MTDFNLILSQVRQRLEILYQIVNDLEASGGGGGGGGTSDYSDLTNKPKINSVTLSGNKSSSDLGLASADALAAKANAADVYAKSETYNKTEVYTKAETVAEIGGAITDLDVPAIGGSTKYVKSVGQADGLVTAETGNIDASPTSSSTNLVQSGGVYSALADKLVMSDVWGLSTNNISATAEAKVNLDDETYWAPGLYRVQSGTVAANVINGPITDAGYVLVVRRLQNWAQTQYADNRYVRQEAYTSSKPEEFYVRHRRGGTGWTSWYKFSGTEFKQHEEPAAAQSNSNLLMGGTIDREQLGLTVEQPATE